MKANGLPIELVDSFKGLTHRIPYGGFKFSPLYEKLREMVERL